MVIKMIKTEIQGKNIKYAHKIHILLFIIGFCLLGAILELIFRDNANNVFPVVLIAMSIIYSYIKDSKWFKIYRFLNLRVNNVNGG